jgi:hypothetical protein
MPSKLYQFFFQFEESYKTVDITLLSALIETSGHFGQISCQILPLGHSIGHAYVFQLLFSEKW